MNNRTLVMALLAALNPAFTESDGVITCRQRADGLIRAAGEEPEDPLVDSKIFSSQTPEEL